MKYTIKFSPPADNELIDLWTNSADKTLVTAVVNRPERLLGFEPRWVGEARQSPLTRVILSPPVGMWFDIIEDDLKVLILHVWGIE